MLETEKELPMRKENTQESVVFWKTIEGNIYRRKEWSNLLNDDGSSKIKIEQGLNFSDWG